MPTDLEDTQYVMSLTGSNGTLTGTFFVNETAAEAEEVEITNQHFIRVTFEDALTANILVADYAEEEPEEADFEPLTEVAFVKTVSGVYVAEITLLERSFVIYALGTTAVEVIDVTEGVSLMSGTKKALPGQQGGMMQRMMPAILMSVISMVMMKFQKKPQAKAAAAAPEAEAAGEAKGEAKGEAEKKSE